MYYSPRTKVIARVEREHEKATKAEEKAAAQAAKEVKREREQ